MKVEYEHEADGSHRWRVETDPAVERIIVRWLVAPVILLGLGLARVGLPSDLLAWLIH